MSATGDAYRWAEAQDEVRAWPKAWRGLICAAYALTAWRLFR